MTALRKIRAARETKPHRPRFFRPQVELLEDRSLLSGSALPPAFLEINQTLQLPDGKTVVVGNSWDSPRCPPDGWNSPHQPYDLEQFTVARFQPDGQLDPTFAGSGVVRLDLGPRSDSGNSVALQADGKVVAVGVSGGTDSNVRLNVVRFNPDGTLDSTFGSGGVVSRKFFEIGPGDAAVQPDGKIVVVAGGQVDWNSAGTFLVLRYDADGSPDPTFGTAGLVETSFHRWAWAEHVALQDDGALLVSGQAEYEVPWVVPYDHPSTPTGVLIPARGLDSVLGMPWDLFVTPAHINHFAIAPVQARYLADGSLDVSFGVGGEVESPPLALAPILVWILPGPVAAPSAAPGLPEMNDPSPLPNPSSDDTSAPLAPPSSDSLGGETAPASQPAQQQTSENDPAPAPVADTSPVPVATEQPVVEPPSAQVTVEPPSVQAAVEPAKVAPVPPKDVASTPGNMVEVAASGTPPVLVQELSFSPPLSETPPTGEALTPLGSTVLLAPIPMFQNPPKAEVLPPDSESTTDSLWSGEVETLWAAKPEADSNDASAFSWMAFDDLTEKLT